MAHKITDDCIGCTACLKICPTGAISGKSKELHIITPELCIDCSACGKVCPKGSVINYQGEILEKIKKSEFPKPVIGKKCMACTICVETCPVGVLEMNEKDCQGGDPFPVLTRDKDCISCGFCEKDCPVDAISMEVVGV